MSKKRTLSLSEQTFEFPAKEPEKTPKEKVQKMSQTEGFRVNDSDENRIVLKCAARYGANVTMAGIELKEEILSLPTAHQTVNPGLFKLQQFYYSASPEEIVKRFKSKVKALVRSDFQKNKKQKTKNKKHYARIKANFFSFRKKFENFLG